MAIERPFRAAWVMSRFPRLTETFVLHEIIAAHELGLDVDVYPLLRERATVMHPEARRLLDRVRYVPFASLEVVRSQAYWLRRRPGAYLRALVDTIRGTWGSLKFLAGALAIFAKVARVAQLLQDDGVAHVHCHFANHPALAGFVIHRLTGIPFSFTAHGSDLHVDRHMLCQKVREAAFVVAISEFNRRVILDECSDSSDKVKVIHCGVDPEFFTPPESRPASDELSILCVGRFAPWKGQERLIEACRLLAQRHVPFQCRLVGGAGDVAGLSARIAEAGLQGRVQILGWKVAAEIAELMRTADVLVAPSEPVASGKKEGIPVVLMEAQATGLAVIASAITGIPELVEHERTGLLVPPADPAALADALQRLHASPDLRRRLGSAGREKVLAEFELRANAAELVRHVIVAKAL